MHLRIATVRRGSKTYQYAQLVESYRRGSDGRPTCRVIASLGKLDDLAIANLRNALNASREGSALVVPEPARSAKAELPSAVVESNLRYLDLAVLLRLWEDLGLSRLVRGCLPASEATVDGERVIAALVLHRCVSPDSKLAAERWYPTTALPELLAIPPEQFNNSRLHRALGALEAGDAALQSRLPSLLEEREGAFAKVFIDATDTWFVGTGPPLAAKGLDKEGVYRRRVGIVLLCDQRGYPLRWHTLSGRYHDPTALMEMAREAAALPWLKGKPVVLDRAVGNAAAIERLAVLPIHFLTGIPHSEFVSSGAPVEWERIEALQAACEGEGAPSEEEVAAAGRRAGLEQVRRDRYVLDLGVFEKARAKTSGPSAAVAAVQIGQFIEAHPNLSGVAIAQALGRTPRAIARDRAICGLAPELQKRVLAGEANGVHVGTLLHIARESEEDQAAAFEDAVAHRPTDRPLHARKKSIIEPPPALRARGILCFNPISFRSQRRTDEEILSALRARAAKINAGLALPKSKRQDMSVLGEIGAHIRRNRFGDVLSARVETKDGTRRLVLEENAVAWACRKRWHGVSILVGHPELTGTAAELVALYFSKDAVEKDFQTIKSVIELRPVRHRTDAKLRAHVTICVLALLLQRALEARLARAKARSTAPAALEILAPTNLNRVQQGPRKFYTITTATPDQRELLATLGMEDLASDAHLGKTITPR